MNEKLNTILHLIRKDIPHGNLTPHSNHSPSNHSPSTMNRDAKTREHLDKPLEGQETNPSGMSEEKLCELSTKLQSWKSGAQYMKEHHIISESNPDLDQEQKTQQDHRQ